MYEPGPNKASAFAFAENMLLHLCKPCELSNAFLASNCVRSVVLPANKSHYETRTKFTRQICFTH